MIMLPQPERHLSERELAERWRISVRTLQRWRRSGLTPPFLKLGRATIYPLRAVLAYEATRLGEAR